MKLVKENINFERGLDPKESMKIGMTMEAKFNHIVDVCKNFGLELEWEENREGDYEIFRRDSRHHTTVFSSYSPDSQEFNTWNSPGTESVDQAIKDILMAEHQNIDDEIQTLKETLINIKRIKEYCSK